MACIYLASLLSSFEQPPEPPSEHRSSHEVVSLLGQSGEWESKFKACVEDLEEICHLLLDLLIHAAQNTSATTSPSTPSSPSPHTHPSPRAPHSSHPLFLAQQAALPSPPPIPYKHDTLMRLKIHLRETEHAPRTRILTNDTNKLEELLGKGGDASALGKNEGTVRFVFGPERLTNSV